MEYRLNVLMRISIINAVIQILVKMDNAVEELTIIIVSVIQIGKEKPVMKKVSNHIHFCFQCEYGTSCFIKFHSVPLMFLT